MSEGARRVRGASVGGLTVVIGVLLALSLALVFGTATSAQALEGSCTISGIVTDAGSGLPLGGSVDIEVWDEWGNWQAGVGIAEDGSGTYLVEGLAPGLYRINTHTYEGHLNQQTWVDLRTATTAAVDFSLVRGRLVSGTVIDQNGDLVSDARVVACDLSGNGVNVAPTYVDGSWAMSVEDGVYLLRTAYTAGYLDQWYGGDFLYSDPSGSTAVPVDVTVDDATGLVITVQAGRTISGTVTDAGTGLPLSWDVDIMALDEAGNYVTSVGIAGDGTYLIEGLNPAVYHVNTHTYEGHLDQQAEVNLSVETTAVVDFSLVRGSLISGTVVDQNGDPVGDARVVACDLDGNHLKIGPTTPSGYWALSVPVGTYLLCTAYTSGYLDQWYGGGLVYSDPSGSLATPVDVTVDDASGIVITVQTGRTISGTVTDAGTALPLGGCGDIEAWDQGGNRVAVVGTDEDGSCSMTLPAGSYRLRTVCFNGYLDEWYDDLPCYENPPEAGALIDATNGDHTGIDFALQQCPSISGTVTDENGQPLQGAMVLALDWDEQRVLRGDETDENGEYTLVDVEPGSYRLRTVSYQAHLDEWYGGALVFQNRLGTGSTIVDVGLTDLTEMDFVLEEGHLLSGILTDANGEPLDMVGMNAIGSDGTFAAGCRTRADGSWAMGVPDGTYQVFSISIEGVLDTWYSTVTFTPTTPTGDAPEDYRLLSSGWEVDLGSGTLTGEATITFPYDPTSLPPGVQEEDLTVWHFEDGEWQNVTVPPVDTVNHLVTARVSSFSPFALGAPANQAPSVLEIVAAPLVVPVGASVALTASFTDADAGDAHAATWQWDRNQPATETGTVTASGPTTGRVTDTHSYDRPGVYEVTLRVTDAAGAVAEATFQYVVVYDPAGGFVTGGGWINSPPGAYAADPALVGKASFGFESKYKKGATVPSGSTQFQFHAAGFSFRSTSYEWLVIAGAKAQYKGIGTVNGLGTYGFMLTAVDGDLKQKGLPDLFRLKIWDRETGDTIYDNQMNAPDTAEPATVLGGGSIVIHK